MQRKTVDTDELKHYYIAMKDSNDKKALFFDFDGTLWFGKYGDKTLETLKKLHEKGYILVYASGRSRKCARRKRRTFSPAIFSTTPTG